MRYSKATVYANPNNPYNQTTMRFYINGRKNLTAIVQEALNRDYWIAVTPMPEDEYSINLRWEDGNKLEGFIARLKQRR